jgi:hypothetical protein
MAEEVRAIVRSSVRKKGGTPPPPLGTRLRDRLAAIGIDEDIPEGRNQQARPAEFSE